MQESWDVIVVGAGPAGLTAAARAAERGRRTVLLEKNRKVGVKILMSGGTRCNLTHATDAAGIIAAFGRPARFLHSALAALGPDDVVRLFAAEGVPTRVEPDTGKVFPLSDRAQDVQQALLRRAARAACHLNLGTPVQAIERRVDCLAVLTADGWTTAARLIVTTGGRSYPGCGTTGDAYPWLSALGHTIVTPRPALVPVTSDAAWVAELRGISLPDTVVRVLPRATLAALAEPAERLAVARKRLLAERRGALLLTHFGLSGPAVMDVSRAITDHENPRDLDLVCDLLPNRSFDELEAALARQCAEHGSRSLVHLLPPELPQRLGEAVLAQGNLPRDQRAAELDKPARRRLAGLLKSLSIPVSGTCGFDKAEVTAGGVALAEIDSRTMESKLVPGLFVAGELLDLDGPIGGYNFQAAFSSGWLAGQHA
jgi:predicted Rossmann fold flavoprotein